MVVKVDGGFRLETEEGDAAKGNKIYKSVKQAAADSGLWNRTECINLQIVIVKDFPELKLSDNR